MMCEKYSFNMVGFHTVQNEFKASGGGGRLERMVWFIPYCLLFPVLSDALFISFIEFFSSRNFFFYGFNLFDKVLLRLILFLSSLNCLSVLVWN